VINGVSAFEVEIISSLLSEFFTSQVHPDPKLVIAA